MVRTAIIRIADGLVTNVIDWDATLVWSPSSGHEIRPIPRPFGVGDTWNGAQYIKAIHIPTPDELEDATIPPLVANAVAFRDRTDYMAEPSFAALPALSPT